MTSAEHDSPHNPTVSVMKIIAWCPDDCDESEAREYTGETIREIAEQHAEWMYSQGDQQDCYEVRVRVTKDDHVREWDVTVDVETQVSFSAALAFLVGPRKKSEVSS